MPSCINSVNLNLARFFSWQVTLIFKEKLRESHERSAYLVWNASTDTENKLTVNL